MLHKKHYNFSVQVCIHSWYLYYLVLAKKSFLQAILFSTHYIIASITKIIVEIYSRSNLSYNLCESEQLFPTLCTLFVTAGIWVSIFYRKCLSNKVLNRLVLTYSKKFYVQKRQKTDFYNFYFPGLHRDRAGFWKNNYQNEKKSLLTQFQTEMKSYKERKLKAYKELESVYYGLESKAENDREKAIQHHLKKVDDVKSSVSINNKIRLSFFQNAGNIFSNNKE